MSLRDILRWPDPRLSTLCTPIGRIDADVRTLAGDMLDTMYAAPGRGLAAPQVGVTVRLFVMDTVWKEGTPDPMVFINPKITSRSAEMAVQPEGCLSIPGITVDVSRPAEVTLAWHGLDGEGHTQAFTGFAAACVQHEMDHLEGIVTFDHLPPGVRAERLADYAEAAV